jgi:hypothetical protein
MAQNKQRPNVDASLPKIPTGTDGLRTIHEEDDRNFHWSEGGNLTSLGDLGGKSPSRAKTPLTKSDNNESNLLKQDTGPGMGSKNYLGGLSYGSPAPTSSKSPKKSEVSSNRHAKADQQNKTKTLQVKTPTNGQSQVRKKSHVNDDSSIEIFKVLPKYMKWSVTTKDDPEERKLLFFEHFTKESILNLAKGAKMIKRDYQNTLVDLDAFIGGLKTFLKYKISNDMNATHLEDPSLRDDPWATKTRFINPFKEFNPNSGTEEQFGLKKEIYDN